MLLDYVLVKFMIDNGLIFILVNNSIHLSEHLDLENIHKLVVGDEVDNVHADMERSTLIRPLHNLLENI